MANSFTPRITKERIATCDAFGTLRGNLEPSSDDLTIAFSEQLTIFEDIKSLGATSPDGTCFFFRLPRELRDMIYDYAPRKNTYTTHHIKRIPKRVHVPNGRGARPTHYLPNTLCAGRAVNKQMFGQSTPILIRNTTVMFQANSDFAYHIREYRPLRLFITKIRIHELKTAWLEKGGKLQQAIDFCPRLKDVSMFIHWAFAAWCKDVSAQMNLQRPLYVDTWPAPLFYTYNVRGLEAFCVFVVDIKRRRQAEEYRRQLEIMYRRSVLKPSEDSSALASQGAGR